jgi:hypothetical protein
LRCRLECGNFDNPEMMDSYLLKENEIAEQGEVLNNSWLVCCANFLNENYSENRVYYQGEYIRLVDITQLYIFSTDLVFRHPDFEHINYNWCRDGDGNIVPFNVYRNISYDPSNKKSERIANIQRYREGGLNE